MKTNRSSVPSRHGLTQPARVGPGRVLLCVVCVAGLASCSTPEQRLPEPASSDGAPPMSPATSPTPSATAPAAGAPVTGIMTLADARRVQTEVMDFTDDMTVRLVEAVDAIETESQSVEARVAAHRLKYTVADGATIIAAAQNPRIALVDMLVMVSLQRTLIEQNLVPRFFGPEADRLRQIFADSERQIRSLAQTSLTAEQLAEIDRLILQWLTENPDRHYAGYVRLSEFAGARQVTTGQATSGRPSNVLGFLFIDPLSGLDPTTRELEQTRLFAERAFFYLQRMPTLVSWQAELLVIDTLSEPEIRRVLDNADDAAAAVDRVTTEIESLRAQLPDLIAAERTAALEQADGMITRQREAALEQAFDGVRAEREALIEQLADEQERLGAMAAELRTTVQAGTELSESLQSTLGGVSALVTQLGINDPDDDDEDSEPFRIQDYTVALQEATRTAEELGRLTDSLTGATDPAALEARLALVDQRLLEAEQSADRVVDRVFDLAMRLVLVLLVGLLVVIVLGSALGTATRRTVRRRMRRRPA